MLEPVLKFSLSLILLSTAALGVSTGPAWAYLDPGTGSLILQVLLGGFAGGVLVIRHRIARFFGHARAKSKAGEGEGAEPKRGS